MSTRLVRATALAVCLAVAACGGGGGGGGENVFGDGGEDVFGGSSKRRPESVEALVRELYRAMASDDTEAACALFTERGEYALLDETGEASCQDVMHVIAMEADDPEAFAEPEITIDEPGRTEYDEYCSDGITVDVVEEVDDWPYGAFAYAEQPEGGWAVVGFNTNSCGG